MKKILIFAANPTNTNKLRLDKEVREIENSHKQAANREEVEIISKWAVRVDDLRRELLYHKPNIAHFSGHGEGNDGLVLEDKNGQMQLVSNESLGGLFKLFKNDIDCVVLNACYSQVQAEVIHQYINCVIGMNRAIGDKAAIEFATGFYDGLFHGRNYQDSFEFGKNAIDLASIPELQTPQINIKDSSQSLFDENLINAQLNQINNYIPYRGTSHFVGRRNELIKIHEILHQENNIMAIYAVSGMGGVGKTELAVKYAREYTNDYPGGICWLNARDTNLATQIIQFVQLQMGLEVPQQDFQKNTLTLIQQVAWCWQYWKPPEGLVLLIFDDLTSLEGFSDLLPSNHRFHILMTTRLRDIDVNIEEISLDVLSPEEALQLLINIIGEKRVRHCEEERRSRSMSEGLSNHINLLIVKDIGIASLRRNDENCHAPVNEELAIANELCEWLGYLPLGIELVGRYIKRKPPHFTLAKMLELLKQERLQQEAINPQQKGLSTAQWGVLTAFELSWVELNPETQKIAGLLSLFAENIFVWEWVESTAKFLNWDDSDVETAIYQLYQRHLVQYLEDNGEYFYKIHPLIREFLKIKLTADADINEIKQAFTTTFIEIARTIPETINLEFIHSIKKVIPHLTEIAENLVDALSDESLYSVLNGLASFYDVQGLYALAESWYYQWVSAAKLRLGENHLDYAESLNNLAALYDSQGKYEQAQPLYIQALELYKQLLGINHPLYATSLNNLALLYYFQGKYEQSEPLCTQALELRKQLLGENHPDTATSLNNLALLYDSQGKYEQAECLYIQASQLYKQLLGENHPDYATSLNNLAAFYDSQGKYEQAERLYIQTLELYKQLLGINHPDTATSLNNLAGLYCSQGKYEQAEPLYIQVLELIKQLLGENHPNYASSLNNVAQLYYFQEKYEQAEPLYIQALELTKQLLGENHPDYASSLNNLAAIYDSQGKYEQAQSLYIQTLELYKQLLGINHPLYATSLNNLALFYYFQGKYEQSEPLCTQALELRKQLLGENHPDTATSLNNLALLYDSQGKYEQAECLYIQASQLYKRLLGINHPDYALSLNNLAAFYDSQGKYEQAERLYIQTLELYKQLLGINHPDTATSLNNLASLYYSQGKYEQVQPLCIQALELTKQLVGENHPDYALKLNNLAQLYYSQGNYEQAQPLYIQALKLRKQLLGENHLDYAESLNNLANFYHSQGKYEQAQPLYIQALDIGERVLGANHPNTVTYRENLENLRAQQQKDGDDSLLGSLTRWFLG